MVILGGRQVEESKTQISTREILPCAKTYQGRLLHYFEWSELSSTVPSSLKS